MKRRCKFGVEKYRPKNQFKFGFWKGLGLYLGGGWEYCGKDLEALGASWAVLKGLFIMLVCGVVFKSALGGLWAGFWVDFKGSGTGFGRVLARFLGGNFESSGWFWAIVGYIGLLRRFGMILAGRSKQKQAKSGQSQQRQATASKSEQKQAKAGTIKCGTDFELKL